MVYAGSLIGSLHRHVYTSTSMQRALTHDLSAPHDRLNIVPAPAPSGHLDESGKDRHAHSIHVATFAPETPPDKFDLLWEQLTPDLGDKRAVECVAARGRRAVEHVRKLVCGREDGGDTAGMVTEAFVERGDLILQDARGEFGRTCVDGGGEGLAAPHAGDDGVSWMDRIVRRGKRTQGVTHWKTNVRVSE